jgi:hypothetical protein
MRNTYKDEPTYKLEVIECQKLGQDVNKQENTNVVNVDQQKFTIRGINLPHAVLAEKKA